MADVVRLVSFNNSIRFFPSASQITSSLFNSSPFQSSHCNSEKKICFPGVSRFSFLTSGKQSRSFKTHATVAETDQPKWWEKNAGPNMIDIHSTEEFLSALSEAGDRLVIVEFYGTWCASCRALFPKLCRTAEDHPEITFLKVNFDENKPMCKSLNVKVLPYFHFYRGAHGRLESFSCSLAKFQKIKDAIEMHNKPPGNIGPSKALEELTLESVSAPSDKQAG